MNKKTPAIKEFFSVFFSFSSIAMLGYTMLSLALGAMVHGLPKNFGPFQILFFKSFFAFVSVLIMVRKNVVPLLRTQVIHWQMMKAAFGLLGNYFWILGLQHLCLATVSALSLTSSFFTMIGGYFFFKERFYHTIWISMAGCLLGVMMIFGLSESLHFKKDMLGDAQYYFLCFPVISALFFSGSSLSIKKIASYDDAVTTVLYLMGLMALGSGIFCIPHWVWPNGKEMLLLIIIGVVYGLCQWLYIKAFSMFHSGFLSVFKFFRFPLNALVGWVFFMEKPPLNVLLGGGVILLMTLFLARVEQRQKQ